jgi:poly(A) polymerase
MLDTHAIAAAAAPAAAASGGAWLVGGAVRDGLLHRQCDDIDLAVAGDAESFARTLATALDAPAFSYSERFSAWRIVCEGGHVDVTPLRGPTIADDLRGRDFTVNAMARTLAAAPGEGASASSGDRPSASSAGSGALIDPCGGLADLRARRLVACAASAFDDDPVRVVRLARLRYELDLTVTPQVEQAAGAAAGRLAAASPERLEHELSALLGLPCVAPALRSLADLGALEVVLPEVAACRGVTQNPYHHLDVFEHTLEALSFLGQVVTALGGERYLATPTECGLPGAPVLAPLAWAVLLHDVGKPLARQVDDQGRVMFLSHDRLGEQIARDICGRLRMSRRFEQFLAELVRQHLRLGFLVREMPLTRRALVRFRRDAQPFVFEAIVLSLADRVATRGERTPPQSLARHFRIARDVFGDTPAPPRRLLGGDEVMTLLGVGPGAAVGRALAVLEEEIECGDVATPDQARAFLLGWWEREQEGARDA